MAPSAQILLMVQETSSQCLFFFLISLLNFFFYLVCHLFDYITSTVAARIQDMTPPFCSSNDEVEVCILVFCSILMVQLLDQLVFMINRLNR